MRDSFYPHPNLPPARGKVPNLSPLQGEGGEGVDATNFYCHSFARC